MITPLGIEIKVGQKWEEIDPRCGYRRVVEVMALDADKQKVQIKWARPTWAQLRRFNGKRGGYKPA